MRNLYYHNFANPRTLVPSVVARDGQRPVLVGNPQFKSGAFWNKSGGVGLEIAEATVNRCPNFRIIAPGLGVYSGEGSTIDGLPSSLFPEAGGCLSRVSVITQGNLQMPHINTEFSTVIGENNVYSVYARVLDKVSTDFEMRIAKTSPNYDVRANITHTAIREWQRFELHLNASYAEPIRAQIIFNRDNGIFEITGPQFEDDQDYCTPFDGFEVQSGIDRLDQHIKIPIAGNFPGMSGGTIVMSIRPDFNYDFGSSSSPTLWSMYLSATNTWYVTYTLASDFFSFYMANGGTDTDIQSAVQSFGRGDKILLIISWDGTNGDLWVNGIQSVTGTKTQRDVMIPGSMHVGTYGGSLNTSIANSVYDELAIFDEPFNQRLVGRVYNNFQQGRSIDQLTN